MYGNVQQEIQGYTLLKLLRWSPVCLKLYGICNK